MFKQPKTSSISCKDKRLFDLCAKAVLSRITGEGCIFISVKEEYGSIVDYFISLDIAHFNSYFRFSVPNAANIRLFTYRGNDLWQKHLHKYETGLEISNETFLIVITHDLQ